MKRIFPRQTDDVFYLSRLLDQLLQTLTDSPLEVRIKALSFDSGIPESIFTRLRTLHAHPEDAPNITARDFYIVFSNILFRFPTVRLYESDDGSIYFTM